MTIIEIRPFRNGWQVYEAPGVQLVFLNWETSDLSLQILCLHENPSFPYDPIWIGVRGLLGLQTVSRGRQLSNLSHR
jgi:hypothetical protein